MRKFHKINSKQKMLPRKASGSIHQFLPAMIFIPMCFVLIMLFVHYNDAMNKKNEIDSVAREYLLCMERRGGLVPADQDRMMNDLSDYGFYNIDISGTDLNAGGASGVGYGNPVTIRICATCDTYMLRDSTSNAFQLAFVKTPKNIVVEYTSTAKN